MLEFQNELDMFQQALDLQEPWFVSYREFRKEQSELHVSLNFRRGAKFPCPNCGAPHNRIHDIVNQDRTWRHLNFFEYKTILHARLPRIWCANCKKIVSIHIDWARPSAGFTWKFDSYVMSLMKEMPVAAVAREVGEHDTRLWRVFHYYVNRAMKDMDISGVKRIALDETSSKRGHQYVTLFIDMDSKKVLLAVEGKDSNVVQLFRNHLEVKGVSPKQIEEFCCDMSPSFISGIEEHFPKAQITFDKFHVMKMVNEAVDEVRREEQKEAPVLKKRVISG